MPYPVGDPGDLEPNVGDLGPAVEATSAFDGWGYIHLFDAATMMEIDTYAIPGPRGSGVVRLNGPAARLAHVGDLVIILTYAEMEREELLRHTPKVVMVDERNRIATTSHAFRRGGTR